MAPGTGGSGWEIERRWLVRVREGLREGIYAFNVESEEELRYLNEVAAG